MFLCRSALHCVSFRTTSAWCWLCDVRERPLMTSDVYLWDDNTDQDFWSNLHVGMQDKLSNIWIFTATRFRNIVGQIWNIERNKNMKAPKVHLYQDWPSFILSGQWLHLEKCSKKWVFYPFFLNFAFVYIAKYQALVIWSLEDNKYLRSSKPGLVPTLECGINITPGTFGRSNKHNPLNKHSSP